MAETVGEQSMCLAKDPPRWLLVMQATFTPTEFPVIYNAWLASWLHQVVIQSAWNDST